MGLVILANLWKGKQGEKLDRCILLRVLDIEHTYENAVIVAAQHGILTSSQIDGKTPATRGDIVDMTYAAVQLLNN